MNIISSVISRKTNLFKIMMLQVIWETFIFYKTLIQGRGRWRRYFYARFIKLRLSKWLNMSVIKHEEKPQVGGWVFFSIK